MPEGRAGRDGQAGEAYLVLAGDVRLAETIAVGVRSRLAGAGDEMPVVVAPMVGGEFAAPGAASRLRAWWDRQGIGVELSSATLVIVDAEELAGLGRIAYVAVPPGQAGSRSYPRGTVVEVPAATVRDLLDAAVSSGREPGRAVWSPRSEARPLWSRNLVRTAVLTGALGIGGWLLSAAFQPGQAQADTVHHQHQHHQRAYHQAGHHGRGHREHANEPSALEHGIRARVNERLRESGIDQLPHRRLPHVPRLSVPGSGFGPELPENPARDALRDAATTARDVTETVDGAAGEYASRPGHHAHKDGNKAHKHADEHGDPTPHKDGVTRHLHAEPGTEHHSARPAADRLEEAARSAQDAEKLADRVAGMHSPAAQAAHQAARQIERMARPAHHRDPFPIDKRDHAVEGHHATPDVSDLDDAVPGPGDLRLPTRHIPDVDHVPTPTAQVPGVHLPGQADVAEAPVVDAPVPDVPAALPESRDLPRVSRPDIDPRGAVPAMAPAEDTREHPLSAQPYTDSSGDALSTTPASDSGEPSMPGIPTGGQVPVPSTAGPPAGKAGTSGGPAIPAAAPGPSSEGDGKRDDQTPPFAAGAVAGGGGDDESRGGGTPDPQPPTAEPPDGGSYEPRGNPIRWTFPEDFPWAKTPNSFPDRGPAAGGGKQPIASDPHDYERRPDLDSYDPENAAGSGAKIGRTGAEAEKAAGAIEKAFTTTPSQPPGPNPGAVHPVDPFGIAHIFPVLTWAFIQGKQVHDHFRNRPPIGEQHGKPNEPSAPAEPTGNVPYGTPQVVPGVQGTPDSGPAPVDVPNPQPVPAPEGVPAQEGVPSVPEPVEPMATGQPFEGGRPYEPYGRGHGRYDLPGSDLSVSPTRSPFDPPESDVSDPPSDSPPGYERQPSAAPNPGTVPQAPPPAPGEDQNPSGDPPGFAPVPAPGATPGNDTSPAPVPTGAPVPAPGGPPGAGPSTVPASGDAPAPVPSAGGPVPAPLPQGGAPAPAPDTAPAGATDGPLPPMQAPDGNMDPGLAGAMSRASMGAEAARDPNPAGRNAIYASGGLLLGVTLLPAAAAGAGAEGTALAGEAAAGQTAGALGPQSGYDLAASAPGGILPGSLPSQPPPPASQSDQTVDNPPNGAPQAEQSTETPEQMASGDPDIANSADAPETAEQQSSGDPDISGGSGSDDSGSGETAEQQSSGDPDISGGSGSDDPDSGSAPDDSGSDNGTTDVGTAPTT